MVQQEAVAEYVFLAIFRNLDGLDLWFIPVEGFTDITSELDYLYWDLVLICTVYSS